MPVTVDAHDRLRAFLLTGRPPEPRDEGDAQWLHDAARAQGLTGLLATALEASPGGVPPRLLEARRALAARGLRQLDLAGRALVLLASGGLRALPLKGAALSEALYDCPSHRPMADVDLLVLENAPGARDLLLAHGYVHEDSADHAVVLRDLASGLVVELHHAWTSCPGVFPIARDAVWERSRQSDGIVPRVPSPEDLLVHLALHAAFQHALRLSLVQYLDFRRLLERVALDPALLIEAARAAHAEAALATALTAAVDAAGAPAAPLLAALPGPSARVFTGSWRSTEPTARELARLRWATARGRRRLLLARTLSPGTSFGWRSTTRRFRELAHRWGPGPARRPAPLASPDLAMEVARECLASVGHVRLSVTGTCMEPSLPEGTQVEIAAATRVEPRFGDVVLLSHPAGLRLHRLVWAPLRHGWAWRTAGDRASFLDPPISRRDVLGVVVSAGGQPVSRLRDERRATGALWRSLRHRIQRIRRLLAFRPR